MGAQLDTVTVKALQTWATRFIWYRTYALELQNSGSKTFTANDWFFGSRDLPFFKFCRVEVSKVSEPESFRGVRSEVVRKKDLDKNILC